MNIPDKLYFNIREVSEMVGVESHVLRFWEKQIETLNPNKRTSGQRAYRKKDVEHILKIRNLLYDKKFTIAGANQELRNNKDTRIKISRSGGASQLLNGIRSKLIQLKTKIREDQSLI